MGSFGDPKGHDEVQQVSGVTDSVQLDYDGSGNAIYLGLAEPGTATSAPLWQIRKLAYDGSGNLLNTKWANGSRAFNSIWDDRVSLSYS